MPRDGGIPLGELVDDAVLHTAGSGGGALQSPQDPQALVWHLQDLLYRKAARLAQLGHKMEYFCVSDADLEKLGNDERRITRLRI